jgi:hypothetical protein
MSPLLKFNKHYLVLAILLFAIEVLIALFVHDQIIRPYIGDVLVVILIYCSVKAFLDTPVFNTSLAVLAFAFIIETLQYFKIVKLFGLQHSKIATTVIGTSFAWADIFCYILGVLLILLIEKIRLQKDALR